MLRIGWVTFILGVTFMLFIAFGSDRPGGTPEPAWAALEQQLGQKGVKVDTASLIQAASSNLDASVRWMAIEVLGLRKEERARKALQQVLASDLERLVQETAALALARLGDTVGLAALQKFMHTSTNPPRQIFLAARLAELGDSSGYQYVAQGATSQENTHLRYTSVAGLVAFIPFDGGRKEGVVIDSVERLLALAQDQDSKVRKEVLIHLPSAVAKGVPVKKIKPVVEKMAKEDSDPDTRQMAHLLLTAW